LWYSSYSQIKAAGQRSGGPGQLGKSSQLTAELAAVRAELEDAKQKLQAGSAELTAVTNQLNESKRRLSETTTERNDLQTRVQELAANLRTAQQARDGFKNEGDAAKSQAAALRGQLEARHIKVVYIETFAWSRLTNARKGPVSVFPSSRTEYVLCGLGGPNPLQGSQTLSGAIEVRFIGPSGSVKFTVTLPVIADRAEGTWASQAIWGNDRPGSFERGKWLIEVWSEGRKIANREFIVT